MSRNIHLHLLYVFVHVFDHAVFRHLVKNPVLVGMLLTPPVEDHVSSDGALNGVPPKDRKVKQIASFQMYLSRKTWLEIWWRWVVCNQQLGVFFDRNENHWNQKWGNRDPTIGKWKIHENSTYFFQVLRIVVSFLEKTSLPTGTTVRNSTFLAVNAKDPCSGTPTRMRIFDALKNMS